MACHGPLHNYSQFHYHEVNTSAYNWGLYFLSFHSFLHTCNLGFILSAALKLPCLQWETTHVDCKLHEICTLSASCIVCRDLHNLTWHKDRAVINACEWKSDIFSYFLWYFQHLPYFLQVILVLFGFWYTIVSILILLSWAFPVLPLLDHILNISLLSEFYLLLFLLLTQCIPL